MAKVLIPTPLRQFADKHDSVDLAGATVAEVLASLTQKFPDLRKQLFNDEGRMRSFVNVYLNDDDIRYLQKDATPVAAGDTAPAQSVRDPGGLALDVLRAQSKRAPGAAFRERDRSGLGEPGGDESRERGPFDKLRVTTQTVSSFAPPMGSKGHIEETA